MPSTHWIKNPSHRGNNITFTTQEETDKPQRHNILDTGNNIRLASMWAKKEATE